MSLLKRMCSGTRCLLKGARYAEVGLTRGYAKHNPTPTCMTRAQKKEKLTSKCVDDHPKARKAETIAQSFPFYNLVKFDKSCCDTDCADKDFPSFDKCLYKESDKNKRKYQVTWVECPPIAIKPKKICCYPKSDRPPVVRRNIKEKPSTACQAPKKCADSELTCPRLSLARCKASRVPPRCSLIRVPTACVKVKPPYPAFSECSRAKLRKGKRNECGCWDEIPMCELNKIINRRLQSGNTSMNPCDRKD